jgi:hypothetical protein
VAAGEAAPSVAIGKLLPIAPFGNLVPQTRVRVRAAGSERDGRAIPSVTPSARENSSFTPGCAGSKPPREPAQPTPIR